MRIAIVFTALAEVSSILVFRNLIEGLTKISGLEIDLYYFDVKSNFKVLCPSKQIKFFQDLPTHQYDIVHSTGIRPDLYIFLNRKKFPKHTKFITTIHSFIGKDLANKYNSLVAIIATKFWLFILKYHHVVVVLTNCAKTHYLKKINNEIRVINNGRSLSLNPTFLKSDVEIILEAKKNYKIIATHAVITKIKGLDVVVRALKYLPNYIFIVFGNGDDVLRLKKLAHSLGVSDRCLFMGRRKCIESYFQYYDLYVMPSLSEGLPMALLEAVSNKTPCLTSNIATFQEIFTEDEVPKFLAGNEFDFKDKVLKFENSIYRDSVIQNAHDKYMQCYTNEVMCSNYLKLYTDLCQI